MSSEDPELRDFFPEVAQCRETRRDVVRVTVWAGCVALCSEERREARHMWHALATWAELWGLTVSLWIVT